MRQHFFFLVIHSSVSRIYCLFIVYLIIARSRASVKRTQLSNFFLCFPQIGFSESQFNLKISQDSPDENTILILTGHYKNPLKNIRIKLR